MDEVTADGFLDLPSFEKVPLKEDTFAKWGSLIYFEVFLKKKYFIFLFLCILVLTACVLLVWFIFTL